MTPQSRKQRLPSLQATLGVLLLLGCNSPAHATSTLIKVRLSADENPFVVQLAESLGYFAAEGLEVTVVDLLSVTPEDYMVQAPLIENRIDASYHWFQHAVFGARHGLPIKAVMVFNDAPGMTVFVANRVKSEIRGAVDFKGRKIAAGAGYGTKSVLTSYLAAMAGLPKGSYTPVMIGVAGRQEAVLDGLRNGLVDVMTFQEPISAALRDTGLVTTLFDLNTRESTTEVLGAAWLAQCLLVSPRFIAESPETVQRLVNAFLRTMRFVNSHTAEEIAAQLPRSWFDGKDRAAAIRLIRDTLPTYASGDFGFREADVRLVLDTINASEFDGSEAGLWRAASRIESFPIDHLYTNEFVSRAMKVAEEPGSVAKSQSCP